MIKLTLMNKKIIVIILLVSQQELFSTGIAIEELKEGKIVTEEEIVDGRSGGVKAVFWVNAKPEVVFRELSDGGKFSEFMPDITLSIVKNAGDNFQDVYYKMHFWFASVEYVLHRIIDRENMEIRWNLLNGKFRRIDGYWKIMAGDGGSIVTYYTDVEPGFYVPHSITVYLTKKGLPELVEAVRKRAESDGKWKKKNLRK